MIFRAIFYTILLVFLIAIYYRLRLYFSDIKVTSWWRTPWRNKSVGGVEGSLHLIGWAFDVLTPTPTHKSKLKSIGFGTIIDEGTHTHAQVI